MNKNHKVNKLLREISKETSVLSFIIPDHPKLLEIIAIGEDAVPVLLEHVKESAVANKAGYPEPYDFHDYSPWYAFVALGQITKVNPIKPDNAGRLYDITQDWLDWAENPDTLSEGVGNLTYWPLDDETKDT